MNKEKGSTNLVSVEQLWTSKEPSKAGEVMSTQSSKMSTLLNNLGKTPRTPLAGNKEVHYWTFSPSSCWRLQIMAANKLADKDNEDAIHTTL